MSPGRLHNPAAPRFIKVSTEMATGRRKTSRRVKISRPLDRRFRAERPLPGKAVAAGRFGWLGRWLKENLKRTASALPERQVAARPMEGVSICRTGRRRTCESI